jgi:hypothetical protein
MQYRAMYEKLRLIEKAHTVINPTLTAVCAISILYYIMLISGIYA